MSSNFDELLNALAEVQARRPGPAPVANLTPKRNLAKSFGCLGPALTEYRPLDREKFDGVVSTIKRAQASLMKEKPTNSQAAKRDQFFKSLSGARAKLGQAIAAGKISADDACIVEAGLHRLAQRGIELVAAERTK